MSARSDLHDALKPLLPPRWKIIPTERTIDKPDAKTFTVVIRQRKIEPAPNGGSLLITLVVTLICPSTLAAENWEDELDLAAAKLVTVVGKGLPRLLWKAATKKLWNDTYPAYDFDVTVVAPLIAS